MRAGLPALVRGHVTIAAPTGVNAAVKVGCQLTGMAAGRRQHDDMDVLRLGAMSELFRAGSSHLWMLGAHDALEYVHLVSRSLSSENALL